MAWTGFPTWVVGQVSTASDWNTYVAANMAFLAGVAANQVATQQSSASTSYTDLSTVGPAVTLVTGANAIVAVGSNIENANLSVNTYMSYAVSGASTVAANDQWSVAWGPNVASGYWSMSFVSFQTGLTPGSNTFTAKYRCSGGTGFWAQRYLVVWPLP